MSNKKGKNMDFNKQTRNHILQILIIGILVYCGIQRLDVVFMALGFIARLLKPFLIGAVIAFVFNVPMKKIEKNLIIKKEKLKKFRRPIAYIITLFCVVGILAIVLAIVIPELADTFAVLIEKIPHAFYAVQSWAIEIPEKYPALEPTLKELQIDWTALSNMAVEFVKNLAAGMVDSGIGLVSNIIGGIATFVIAFTFSIYVLMQKEKLISQTKQILYALLSDKVTEKILEIGTLSNQTFSNFLSGQCVEAIILGTMFVITMSIFGMPYAMLTGIVIAVTALIPIFGAFIGCGVGMVLIFMENPVQSLWFLLLFLVLQQIEGNLIYPHVVGNSVGLPSIWVLVAVSIGGSLFGIVGILVFIPLCSVLYTLFKGMIKKRLKDRKVPPSKLKE